MNSLNTRLHELADAEPGSAPPIDRLLERGRRNRRRRHTTTVALSVLAAAAIALTAIAAIPKGSGPQQQAVEPRVEPRVDPRLELVAALANTEGTSFKIRATNTKLAGDEKRSSYVSEGAFDPATTTGYLRFAGDKLEIRLIDGIKYVSKDGERFVQIKGRSETLGFDAPVLDGELTASADSQRLFEVLRQAEVRVTKTGDGTYHFEAASDTMTLVGDIVLDRQQRVTRIEYDYHREGQLIKMRGVLEFSDYGTPVRVDPPANVVNVD
jgi:hypothetical protein